VLSIASSARTPARIDTHQVARLRPAAPTAYERRREPRRAIRLPVRYRIDGTEIWLQGSALDLSDCGILL